MPSTRPIPFERTPNTPLERAFVEVSGNPSSTEGFYKAKFIGPSGILLGDSLYDHEDLVIQAMTQMDLPPVNRDPEALLKAMRDAGYLRINVLMGYGQRHLTVDADRRPNDRQIRAVFQILAAMEAEGTAVGFYANLHHAGWTDQAALFKEIAKGLPEPLPEREALIPLAGEG